VDKSREAGVPYPPGDNSPRAEDSLESRNYCAFNQTRGYVLGVEIVFGDYSRASLAGQIPLLTPKSGAGVWLLPFKGIPVTDARFPLDLIYLDADCRVIEAVEFYPTFRVSPTCPPAASVLALPAHSVYVSHTQPGDQLVFGLAEEIDRLLKEFFGLSNLPGVGEEALVAREEPLSGTAPGDQHAADQPSEEPAAAQPVEPAEPWKKNHSKPKNWLQRFLSPDPPEPRKAPRAALPGLIAFFWTGGSPHPHAIRDISSTGLYVVTEERWYPGTLIQMTLKKSGSPGSGAESSISLLARANRWGNDGVGLSFVVRDPRNPRDADAAHADGADREELDRFLARIGQGNG
jgi:hypothetical protein